MSLLEMRLALYLLVTVILNGLTIAAIALEGSWRAALLPLAGTGFAIQYGRTLPRKEAERPGAPGRPHAPKTPAP